MPTFIYVSCLVPRDWFLSATPSLSPGLGWTPTFAVEDFDATVASVRAAGVVFDAEEEGGDEGYRLLRIRDPEGSPIGLAAG